MVDDGSSEKGKEPKWWDGAWASKDDRERTSVARGEKERKKVMGKAGRG